MVSYKDVGIDQAIRGLAKKMASSGLERELKVRSIPKKSVRRRFKEHLSERRRLRNVGRKPRYVEGRER